MQMPEKHPHEGTAKRRPSANKGRGHRNSPCFSSSFQNCEEADVCKPPAHIYDNNPSKPMWLVSIFIPHLPSFNLNQIYNLVQNGAIFVSIKSVSTACLLKQCHLDT